jgi:hypothetical protein
MCDGLELPYLRYFALDLQEIGVPALPLMKECLFLGVPESSYNSKVSSSIRTNLLSVIMQMIDYYYWLIIYCFTSRSRIFHLYGDVTNTGERLQNLGLYSALRAFEQGGIFIVPHLLWHGTSVFPVSSEGPPLSVAFYDTQGDVEDLF